MVQVENAVRRRGGVLEYGPLSGAWGTAVRGLEKNSGVNLRDDRDDSMSVREEGCLLLRIHPNLWKEGEAYDMTWEDVERWCKGKKNTC